MQNEFAHLLTENQHRIYSYLYAQLRNLNDVDEVYQRTTMVLWEKFDQFDTERQFANWAMGIARIEIANFLKQRGRSKLYFSDKLNLLLIESCEKLDQDKLDDRKDALQECLSELRTDDRKLIDDCYAEKDGVNTVAKQLGRTTQSIYNTLRRLRRNLLQCINQKTEAIG